MQTWPYTPVSVRCEMFDGLEGGMDGLTWASFNSLIGIPMLPMTV